MKTKILKNKFIKDIGITTIGQIIVMILAFALNKIISIKLGPEHFMEYSLIHKTASVITYVMILSLGIALPRYLAIFRESKDKNNEYLYLVSSLIIALISSTLTFIICFLFKNNLSIIIFGNDNKYIEFIVPMLLLSLQMGNTTLLYSYYRGIDDFVKYNISQCVISILNIFSCFISTDLIVIVDFMSIFGIITSIIAFLIILKKYRCKIVKSDLKHSSKVLLKYSLPRVPGEFILFSFTLLPMIIINKRIGLERSAGYSVALGILTAVTPLYRYIGMVMLPYVSKTVINKDINSVNHKIKKLLYIYIITSIIEIISVFTFTNLIITILYSKEYIVYGNIVKIVSISILPNCIYLLLRNPLDALSDIPINSINLFISFIFMIIFTYFSNNELLYSFSFFVGYFVLGTLSIISWLIVKKIFKNKHCS